MNKKTVKRKTRTVFVKEPGPYRGMTEADARAQLHRKILSVAVELPEVKTTGNAEDKASGEQFCFTRYADVLKEVVPVLTKYNLTFTPYADPNHQTNAWNDRGMFFCRTYFALTDADTGYQMIVPGCGMGMNRYWSLDSAMTLALKHALLQALMIRWDNTGPWDKLMEECFDKRTIEETVTNAVRNELKMFNWFGGQTNAVQHNSNRPSGSPGTPETQRTGRPAGNRGSAAANPAKS
jgi:hypothetical protein